MASAHSESGLRAELDEIFLAINKHRQILKDLDKQKSAIHRQLNSILDPVARLPLEISSEIFVQSLPCSPSFHPDDAPGVLVRVCHGWTAIALSTPYLWTSIGAGNKEGPLTAKRHERLFNRWATRAKGCPISLSLRPSQQMSEAYLVRRYAHQLRKLELHLPFKSGSFASLTAPFHSLKTLTCFGSEPYSAYALRGGFLELLRHAPNLEECTLVGFEFHDVDDSDTDSDGDTDSERTVVPPLNMVSLRHLKLGQFDRQQFRHANSVILQYLTLPALRSLAVSNPDIPHNDFVSFLARSSPPLRSLSLNWSNYDIGGLEELLRHLPSLTQLDIRFEPETSTSTLFERFACARDIVPQLRYLTICVHCFPFSQFHIVSDVLERRRGSLRSFRLRADTGDPGKCEVLLRDLKVYPKQEMHVFIGDWHHEKTQA
ncbi:hypothetical protein FB45DRAFT_906914 [Roridomyces roridus]|uniref:F-box domain-containing protein n=1 Tax=Roridomyces roridus TaxID=1738132 RepID=A0AAD7FSC8_9AGAR|nr:hypothetical protein FB45DRAFT_906914 [Roridomyces roridus]